MYAKRSLISTYRLDLWDDSDIEWAIDAFGFSGPDDFPCISFFVNGESVYSFKVNSHRKLVSPYQVDFTLGEVAASVGMHDMKVHRLLQTYERLKQEEDMEVNKLG